MALKSRIIRKHPNSRISLYARHGPSTGYGSDAVLTDMGPGVVRMRSKILPEKKGFLIRTSPVGRAVQTAGKIVEVRPGKIVRVDLLSPERLILNRQKFEDYFKGGKTWAHFLRDWLDGKLTSFTVSPEAVAKEVLSSLEWEHKPKEKVAVNITHAMILESLLEKLIGKKYESLAVANARGKKEIGHGEGFILYFAGEKKIILEFNKLHYDVTKNFFAIIHSNK